MIQVVTNNRELFDFPEFEYISLEQAVKEVESWDRIQFDTETGGRNPHICDLLCAQFGNKAVGKQIVIDCSSIDIRAFKKALETKLIIGQNLKFDCQFLYKYEIIPTNTWDTMIAEQVLYLGYPYVKMTDAEYKFENYDFPYHRTSDGYLTLSFALDALCKKYLNIEMDKTVRGEIIWRGFDSAVIKYAAMDVVPLEDIYEKQIQAAKYKNCLKAVELQCRVVPTMAYLEWCGIKLSEEKWQKKMEEDSDALNQAENDLNKWLVEKSKTDARFKPYVHINLQGDLFSGFDSEPKVSISWSSPKQIIPIFQLLGFNTEVKDKKSSDMKDSIMEKVLSTQKGIDDEFLKKYFLYQEKKKVVTTYGQQYLDAINPKTGRIHSTFRQIGADSSRMACGSKESDTDLAKLKKISESRCKYVQLQNLPADDVTRGAFVPNNGNLMTSCDYSA